MLAINTTSFQMTLPSEAPPFPNPPEPILLCCHGCFLMNVACVCFAFAFFFGWLCVLCAMFVCARLVLLFCVWRHSLSESPALLRIKMKIPNNEEIDDAADF